MSAKASLRRAILVTGTDTGVGKTYVACLVAKGLQAAGLRVLALKPVESGCGPGPGGTRFPADAAALRDATDPGRPLSDVCLYALGAPLSPHLAARLEGVDVDPDRVRGAVAAAAAAADVVLVEGAGGITVDLAEGFSFLDLARDLALPVLVVAGNRLGVLNHLELTLRCLASEGIPVFGVLLNDVEGSTSPARESNEAEARRIAGAKWMGRLPFCAEALPAPLLCDILARL